MSVDALGSPAIGRRNALTFAGTSSKEFALYLSGPGVYDAPAPDIVTTSIPGLNGDLIQDNAKAGMRRFQNVDITYEAFFVTNVPARTAAVKSWLLSPVGYQKLTDTYDEDFYRMAMCTQAIPFEVTGHKAATMQLIFNCKPQRWSVEGQETVTIASSGSVLRNPFQFYAQPLIVVTATGATTLTIGDQSVYVTADAAGTSIVLDCETENAYRADTGAFCNDMIQSDEFPVLAPGENVITWSGSATIQITPRWWTL